MASYKIKGRFYWFLVWIFILCFFSFSVSVSYALLPNQTQTRNGPAVFEISPKLSAISHGEWVDIVAIAHIDGAAEMNGSVFIEFAGDEIAIDDIQTVSAGLDEVSVIPQATGFLVLAKKRTFVGHTFTIEVKVKPKKIGTFHIYGLAILSGKISGAQDFQYFPIARSEYPSVLVQEMDIQIQTSSPQSIPAATPLLIHPSLPDSLSPSQSEHPSVAVSALASPLPSSSLSTAPPIPSQIPSFPALLSLEDVVVERSTIIPGGYAQIFFYIRNKSVYSASGLTVRIYLAEKKILDEKAIVLRDAVLDYIDPNFRTNAGYRVKIPENIHQGIYVIGVMISAQTRAIHINVADNTRWTTIEVKPPLDADPTLKRRIHTLITYAEADQKNLSEQPCEMR
ncbi:MAG: hypothetical protein G01um101466_839 [Parcubacteria group bacterium Gr01-1014_66]|nr:MAG: hypothetical protein G01um101466_839 [Parcubacteria group bacterium Gr01-1014_66]